MPRKGFVECLHIEKPNKEKTNPSSIVSSMETMTSQIPYLSLLFTLVPIIIFFFFLKSKKRTQQNLPPGPAKLPLIGNMTHIMGSHPHHLLLHLAKMYGPLMHLQLGHVSMIVVSSPEIAENIMKTHDLSFASRPVTLPASIITYGCADVGFSPYGPYWRQVRKICVLELLSAKSVRSFRFLRESEISSLVRSMLSDTPTTVNLTEMIILLVNNVVSKATIGKKYSNLKGMREVIRKIIKLGSGFNLGDFFPSLQFVSVVTGFKRQLEEVHVRLDSFFDEIIKQHKEKKEKRDDEEEDLVDVLLRLQKSDTLDMPLTDDNMKAIIFDMFIGGTDTTSSVIEWAMVELMRNPRCMEKAQKEIREILQGKEKVEESDIQGLKYMNLVIKETLRLHPPLPLLLPRESMERCTIHGYDIPAKTRVMVNAYAIGRDPKYWENAEDFQPERFSENLIEFNGQNFKYLPFGAGRRGCPGMLFGTSVIELALANLLYYFDWKLPDGMKPMDLDMAENFGVTVERKASLILIPIPLISLENV